MSVNSSLDHLKPQPAINIMSLALRIGLVMIVFAALLFISAGRLDWVMAWVYVAVLGGLTFINRWLLLRKYPDLIAERSHGFEGRQGVKSWDRVLAPFITLCISVLAFLIAGLDVRFGWSPAVPLMIQIGAVLIVAVGYGLGHWAMMANRFFSAVVRIQKDRGHTVVTGGPYRYVRHPGYVSGIIVWLATPLALGSLWALIPALLGVGAIVIRTGLEDKTLQEELAGYKDYARQVRYRLLPGVW